MATRNPFRSAPGVDPPALVGRDRELSLIDIALRSTEVREPTAPVIITGRRGMGKTVLLRRARALASGLGGVVISAEAQRHEPLAETLRSGLEAAHNELSPITKRVQRGIDRTMRALPKPEYTLPHDAGTIGLAQPDDPKPTRFSAQLSELNERAQKRSRFLAFLIDEIQEASIEDLSILITFIHESAGTTTPALLLAAGLPNARGHLHEARTYTERWRYTNIGLLDRDQTRAAIEIPVIAAGHTVEAEALDVLSTESAGYPYFIQEYASAAWIRQTGTTITLHDVNAVVPGVRRGIEASLYDGAFSSLTPREVRYVLTLAELGPGPHAVYEVADRLGLRSDRLSSVRNSLIKKDILFDPAYGLIEFRIPLTERYIEANIDQLTRRSIIRNAERQS